MLRSPIRCLQCSSAKVWQRARPSAPHGTLSALRRCKKQNVFQRCMNSLTLRKERNFKTTLQENTPEEALQKRYTLTAASRILGTKPHLPTEDRALIHSGKCGEARKGSAPKGEKLQCGWKPLFSSLIPLELERKLKVVCAPPASPGKAETVQGST